MVGPHLVVIGRFAGVLEHFLAARIVLLPLLLLFVEEAGVPIIIPGDMVIAYTGFKVSVIPDGPGLWQAFLTALISVLAGSTILFFISRRWGQTILVKLGKFMFIQEKQVQQAERLFAKYGWFAVIIGRYLPGLRMPVTVFAGASGVSYPTFIASTLVSTSAWVIACLIAGRRLGVDLHGEFQHYMMLSFIVMGGLTVGIMMLHVVGMYREARRKKRGLEATD